MNLYLICFQFYPVDPKLVPLIMFDTVHHSPLIQDYAPIFVVLLSWLAQKCHGDSRRKNVPAPAGSRKTTLCAGLLYVSNQL